MREGAKRVIITVSALALIGITAFCISGTVHSSEKVERREREKYYREIEAEYVKEVRFFLNEEGYSNSGVMPQQNPRHERGFCYSDLAPLGRVVRVSEVSFYGTDFRI